MRPSAASTLVLLLLASAVLCGCGDDDSHDGARVRDGGAQDGGSESEFASGAGGRAARGGSPAAASGGSGGRGEAGREAIAGRPAPAACGEVTCEVPRGSFAIPCCLDEATSACGFSVLGRCQPPAEPDPDCPSLDFAGILVFPSCCNARNMCGIDTSSVGGPTCLDLASAAERARMSGATAVFPPPRPCDPSDGEDPGDADDAGVSDASGSDAGGSDDAGS